MTGFIKAAAEALERLAAIDETAEARYGRRVGPNAFERHENGVIVSTMVVQGETGTVVYQVPGLSFADLL